MDRPGVEQSVDEHGGIDIVTLLEPAENVGARRGGAEQTQWRTGEDHVAEPLPGAVESISHGVDQAVEASGVVSIGRHRSI